MYKINKTGKEYAKLGDYYKHRGRVFVNHLLWEEKDLDFFISLTDTGCEPDWYNKKDSELVGVSYENFKGLLIQNEKIFHWGIYEEAQSISKKYPEGVSTSVEIGFSRFEKNNDLFEKRKNETLPEFFLRVLIKTQILTKKD